MPHFRKFRSCPEVEWKGAFRFGRNDLCRLSALIPRAAILRSTLTNRFIVPLLFSRFHLSRGLENGLENGKNRSSLLACFDRRFLFHFSFVSVRPVGRFRSKTNTNRDRVIRARQFPALVITSSFDWFTGFFVTTRLWLARVQFRLTILVLVLKYGTQFCTRLKTALKLIKNRYCSKQCINIFSFFSTDDLVEYVGLVAECAPNTPLFYYHIPAWTHISCRCRTYESV